MHVRPYSMHSHHPARPPARRNAVLSRNGQLRVWIGVRPPSSPVGPPHVASIDRKRSSILTSPPRPMRSMRYPCVWPPSWMGHRSHRSQPAPRTARVYSVTPAPAPSCVGRVVCRMSITVQRCSTKKASCGLLCTLRASTGRACRAGWRRVCAVPQRRVVAAAAGGSMVALCTPSIRVARLARALRSARPHEASELSTRSSILLLRLATHQNTAQLSAPAAAAGCTPRTRTCTLSAVRTRRHHARCRQLHSALRVPMFAARCTRRTTIGAASTSPSSRPSH